MTFLIVGNLLFWAAVICGLVAVLHTPRPRTHTGPCSPEENQLFDRFVHDEINDDEYRNLRETLRGTAGHMADA